MLFNFAVEVKMKLKFGTEGRKTEKPEKEVREVSGEGRFMILVHSGCRRAALLIVLWKAIKAREARKRLQNVKKVANGELINRNQFEDEK